MPLISILEGRSVTDRISKISDFLLELDALKSINRRTYINGGERVENSAEHSWHLAMACWAFAELLEDNFDTAKLIKLALIHDMGEMAAGDTFLYSKDRDNRTDPAPRRRLNSAASISPGRSDLCMTV